MIPSRLLAQEAGISGNVSDADGNPLPGVSVIIQNTSTGTSTDLEGNYSLENVSADAVLVFSYVGYKSLQEPVNGRRQINVRLEPDLAQLDEVVVVGYGTQRRANVTSAAASVQESEFIKGNVQDAGQLIQGKVAGLTVSVPSGDPASGS